MSTTEQHRFRCEVRKFLKLRLEEGEGARDDYLELVTKKRGAPAATTLRNAAVEQWKKGNRGNPGDWR
jgi:hypothetical protein